MELKRVQRAERWNSIEERQNLLLSRTHRCDVLLHIVLTAGAFSSHCFILFSEEANIGHNSPIYDECQTQSAWVLALPWERAHQDNSNDTPQHMCEFQVCFPLLWIKAYPCFILILSKGKLTWNSHIVVVGYRLNCLDEPVFVTVSKPMQTEFGIHHRLESCEDYQHSQKHIITKL